MHPHLYTGRTSESIQPDHSQPVHPCFFTFYRHEDDDWISFTNPLGINKMPISNHQQPRSRGTPERWGTCHMIQRWKTIGSVWMLRSETLVPSLIKSFCMHSTFCQGTVLSYSPAPYSSFSPPTITDDSVQYFRFEIAPGDIRWISFWLSSSASSDSISPIEKFPVTNVVWGISFRFFSRFASPTSFHSFVLINWKCAGQYCVLKVPRGNIRGQGRR